MKLSERTSNKRDEIYKEKNGISPGILFHHVYKISYFMIPQVGIYYLTESGENLVFVCVFIK